MKISILITVYNRPETLKACLHALTLSITHFDEVVVSDDGSCKEAVRHMKAYFPKFPFPIRYIWQENKGYRLAAARNSAIRHSSGDYLIFLDSDILLLSDAISLHLQHARQGVFLAANRAFLNQDFSNEAVQCSFNSERMEKFWQSAEHSHLRKAERQFKRNSWLRKFGLTNRHKPKILGCHFSLFGNDIKKVNGFDEHYTGWGLEDDDLALRLYKAGMKSFSLITKARALHLWHEPVSSRTERFSDNPNLTYFNRRKVPAYCADGLS